jgi:hypothetical protein
VKPWAFGGSPRLWVDCILPGFEKARYGSKRQCRPNPPQLRCSDPLPLVDSQRQSSRGPAGREMDHA